MREEENLQRIENVVAGEIRPDHLRCTVCGGDVERDTAYAHRYQNYVNVHYVCKGTCDTSAHIQRISRSEDEVEHEFQNVQQLGDSHLTYAQQQERAAFQTGSELYSDGGTATEQPSQPEPEPETEPAKEYVSDRTGDLRPGDRVVVSTYRDDHLDLIPCDVIAAAYRCVKLDVPAGIEMDDWLLRDEETGYLLTYVAGSIEEVDVYRPTTIEDTEEVGGGE